MYKSVIVVPGFSESIRFTEGLANELTSGPFALAEDADIVRVADLFDDPLKYEAAMSERLVVTHSAGIMAVNKAAEIIALNAPEPTRLRTTVRGATVIAFDKAVGKEAGISSGGLLEPVLEVARHPLINAKIPLAIRKFSSSQKLIDNADAFPGGRSLFATEQDQFGFARPEAIARANDNGVFARMLQGKHNHAMFQPKDMMSQIATALAERVY